MTILATIILGKQEVMANMKTPEMKSTPVVLSDINALRAKIGSKRR